MTQPEAGEWNQTAALRDRLPAGWRRHARQAHLDLIEQWIGTPRGRWLKTDLYEELSPHRALLPCLGGSWIGMDVSTAVAAGVKPRVSRITVGDVRRLPFRDGAFDGVLSTSTLDHFDEPHGITLALAELRRILLPSGCLLLTLDNRSNPAIRLRNALPKAAQMATRLVPFPTGVTLSDQTGRIALAEAGFTVAQVGYLLHAPHIVGTRLAHLRWYERAMLPRLDQLMHTRLGRFSAHYVAFLCYADGAGVAR